jgi:hypothetical protein
LFADLEHEKLDKAFDETRDKFGRDGLIGDNSCFQHILTTATEARSLNLFTLDFAVKAKVFVASD